MIGADHCLDYKAPGFKEALLQATEGFVDAYLDLVGGDSKSVSV
jgi:NADPH-dependent curcumin reductase CurA